MDKRKMKVIGWIVSLICAFIGGAVGNSYLRNDNSNTNTNTNTNNQVVNVYSDNQEIGVDINELKSMYDELNNKYNQALAKLDALENDQIPLGNEDGHDVDGLLDTNMNSDNIYVSDLTIFYGNKTKMLEVDSMIDNLENEHHRVFVAEGLSEYTFKLNSQYETISGIFFEEFTSRFDDKESRFIIYNGEDKIFSETVNRGEDPIPFSINISDVDELRIEYFSPMRDDEHRSGIADFVVTKK